MTQTRIQVFGEVGREMDFAAGSFEPYAGLSYVSYTSDDFDEKGGAAALHGSDETTETTFTTLGLRYASDFRMGQSEATLTAGLGWQHAFGDLSPNASMAFSSGSTFSVEGAPIAEDTALLEAGIEVAMGDRKTLTFAYRGELSSPPAKQYCSSAGYSILMAIAGWPSKARVTGRIGRSVLLLSMAAATAAHAQHSDTFVISVELSEMAAVQLHSDGEGVVVLATYSGQQSGLGKGKVTEIGTIDLGSEEVELPLNGGEARLESPGMDDERLPLVEGSVQVNINVFSARKTSADNILACDFFDGDLQNIMGSTSVLLCSLITEGREPEYKYR